MTDHRSDHSVDPFDELLSRLDRPVSPSPDFARTLRARVIAEAELGRQLDGEQTTMQRFTALPALYAGERPDISSKRITKRWMAGLEVAAAVLLLFGTFLALGGGQPARDRFAAWFPNQQDEQSTSLGAAAMYGGDAGRTGQQPGPAPEYEYVNSWTLPTEIDGVTGFAPVGFGDTVYRVVSAFLDSTTDGSVTTVLQAVDIATGEVRWETVADVYGSPAVTADLIFVNVGPVRVGTPDPSGDSLAQLQAFDAATGQLVWRVPTGKMSGQSGATSPLVIENTVYAASPNGAVVAVDGRSGSIIWTSTEGTSPESGEESRTGQPPFPASGQFAGNDASLFVANSGGAVVALDRATGTKQWEIDIEERFHIRPETVEPMVLKDIVILHLRGVDLVESDKNTGQLIDVYVTVEAETGSNLWRRDFAELGGNAALIDGLLIVPAMDETGANIVAIDLSSAEDAWTYRWQGPAPLTVSVAGDELFFSTSDRGLVGLNSVTRHEWSIPTASALLFPAVVSDERIVVQDNNGTLLGFSANGADASPVAESEGEDVGETVTPTPANSQSLSPTLVPTVTATPFPPTVVPPMSPTSTPFPATMVPPASTTPTPAS